MQPISEVNEGGVCSAIVDGAGEALSAYPTNIEDDMAVLREGGMVKKGRGEMAALVSGCRKFVPALCQPCF